jgi:lipopolysaccharide biosynthesis glycosyltransferase
VNIVNIAYVFDDNYAPHACASIASVLEKCDSKRSYHFYLFAPDLELEHREKITGFIETYSQHYTIINTQAFDYANFYQEIEKRYGRGKKNTAAQFFKILFENYLPADVDRIISLDSDTIALSDLSELFDRDLHGQTLAAVSENISKNHLKEIGFARRAIYFNSGVLLIDMKKWREQCVDDALMQRFNNEPNYSMHDQDLLNIEFKDNFFQLPQRYNQMVYLFNVPALFLKIRLRYMLVKGLGEEGIMHYTGAKPWQAECWHPYRHLYFKALAKTPYHDMTLPQDLNRRVMGFITAFSLGRKVVKLLRKSGIIN